MAIGHDHVVAALHIFDCGCSAMTIHWIGAGATCVIAIESKAMCPAIVHVETIVGDDGPHAGRDGLSSGHWTWLGCSLWRWSGHGQCFDKCHMGSVETCLAGGEFVQVFFVVAGEMLTTFDII